MDPNQMPQGMPQPPQGVPPMPPTPTDPGMPAPAMGVPSAEPISPEEKQTLLDLIAKIKSQMSNLEATSFASKNKSDLLRREILKQVFEKLQLAGVDLSSRESVASFIMRLQQQNPELAAMFEKSMDVLMGTPPGGALGSVQPNPGEMGPPDPSTPNANMPPPPQGGPAPQIG